MLLFYGIILCLNKRQLYGIILCLNTVLQSHMTEICVRIFLCLNTVLQSHMTELCVRIFKVYMTEFLNFMALFYA